MSALVSRGGNTRRLVAAFGLTFLALSISLPLWGESSWMREFVEIACYFIFALMWNLMAGYGGMVSVGQQAFFGLGGYLMLGMGNLLGLNPFVAIPIAGLVTALLALPLSKLAFRLRGGYFSIGTWVIAEVLRLTVSNIPAVGGGSGTSLTALRGISRATREHTTYWVALACAVGALALVYWFLRSKGGLALQAIRDSEVAAESQGIAVWRMKLAVYVFAAFGCGLAGALYFVSNLRISPDAAFSVNWTAFAIFIVMIGGIGRIEGPLIGALVFWVLNRFFADYGTWYLLGLGALAVVMTLFFREGLAGFLYERLRFELLPTRRTLEEPEAAAPSAPSATRRGLGTQSEGA
jgi:branched-chain amino acid transport system permease protein